MTSVQSDHFMRAHNASSVFCDALSFAVGHTVQEFPHASRCRRAPLRRSASTRTGSAAGTASFTAEDVVLCIATDEESGKRRTRVASLRQELHAPLRGDTGLIDHLSRYAATLGHLTSLRAAPDTETVASKFLNSFPPSVRSVTICHYTSLEAVHGGARDPIKALTRVFPTVAAAASFRPVPRFAGVFAVAFDGTSLAASAVLHQRRAPLPAAELYWWRAPSVVPALR
jgi:hypothetical protein